MRRFIIAVAIVITAPVLVYAACPTQETCRHRCNASFTNCIISAETEYQWVCNEQNEICMDECLSSGDFWCGFRPT